MKHIELHKHLYSIPNTDKSHIRSFPCPHSGHHVYIGTDTRIDANLDEGKLPVAFDVGCIYILVISLILFDALSRGKAKACIMPGVV